MEVIDLTRDEEMLDESVTEMLDGSTTESEIEEIEPVPRNPVMSALRNLERAQQERQGEAGADRRELNEELDRYAQELEAKRKQQLAKLKKKQAKLKRKLAKLESEQAELKKARKKAMRKRKLKTARLRF